MNIPDLLQECSRAGFHLRLVGEGIRWRGQRPPTELLSKLREYREQLRAHLAMRSTGLPPDQHPWVRTALQILSGEFEGADRSLRESLCIGLRRVRHPLCASALKKVIAAYPAIDASKL